MSNLWINGYGATGPPATRYHHLLWIVGDLARVKLLPFPRLPLDLLVRGSVGHGIQVVPLWHLIRLIVACLKERKKVN